jgi:Flp pilus assembly protein TadG
MKKSLSHRFNTRSEKGAAALEFAIIVPVLLLLVLGMMDIGRLLLVNMSLLSAAHQGARVSAMTSSGTAGSSSVIGAAVSNSMPSAIIQLSLLSGTSTCAGVALSSCVLPTITTSCPGTNSGTTSIGASIAFHWLTPLELIWRFSTTTRTGSSTNVTQTVTAQCLV